MEKIFKKTIMLCCAIITMFGFVGCSNNKTVTTVKEYEETYLSKAKDVTYLDNSDLMLNFGNDSQLGIMANQNDKEKISTVRIRVSEDDIGTKEEETYLNGVLKYADSLNIVTPDERKVSEKILEAKETLAQYDYKNFSKYGSEYITVINKKDVYVECIQHQKDYIVSVSLIEN